MLILSFRRNWKKVFLTAPFREIVLEVHNNVGTLVVLILFVQPKATNQVISSLCCFCHILPFLGLHLLCILGFIQVATKM